MLWWLPISVTCFYSYCMHPFLSFFHSCVLIWMLNFSLSGKKKSGKTFAGEKISHFWKMSHFFSTNFSKFLTFPWPIFKIKWLSIVGLHLLQRKVVLLIWGFSNWPRRSALLVSLIHRIGYCKYTPLWISQNKKFLFKLIFHDYQVFRRIPEEF